ncbi:hypothetical protein [Paenibacillus urinalis]|uniref:hypothetical protein n=1 Tax=Paenibacillus urinalis TaxID=521520 RepID=UPI00196030A7
MGCLAWLFRVFVMFTALGIFIVGGGYIVLTFIEAVFFDGTWGPFWISLGLFVAANYVMGWFMHVRWKNDDVDMPLFAFISCTIIFKGINRMFGLYRSL